MLYHKLCSGFGSGESGESDQADSLGELVNDVEDGVFTFNLQQTSYEILGDVLPGTVRISWAGRFGGLGPGTGLDKLLSIGGHAR